jgi:hypothetical protein
MRGLTRATVVTTLLGNRRLRPHYDFAVPVSKSKRSRYTPPPPKKAPPSPLWVPVSLCVLMVTGLVVVLANYLQALPGNTENRYLIVGLVLITGGFGLATTYR